jgi:hypothetical protein
MRFPNDKELTEVLGLLFERHVIAIKTFQKCNLHSNYFCLRSSLKHGLHDLRESLVWDHEEQYRDFPHVTESLGTYCDE